MSGQKRKEPPKKRKKRQDADEIELDPEVAAFANWFADWWLRRGLRLTEAAKADPDYQAKQKRARRERRLRKHWNEDHTVILLDDSERERLMNQRNR